MCIRDSRVMANNGDNYYIDNKGKIRPIPNSAAHVAVVTGYVDRDFAVKDLYTLSLIHISKNKIRNPLKLRFLSSRIIIWIMLI